MDILLLATSTHFVWVSRSAEFYMGKEKTKNKSDYSLHKSGFSQMHKIGNIGILVLRRVCGKL